MQEPLLHVVPVEHILGKLSLVQAGNTGTIPFEKLRTLRGIRRIVMTFERSITQAVGLTLRLDVGTEGWLGVSVPRARHSELASCST